MTAINYQVQTKHDNGKWYWFSDFRTHQEAKNMLEVYTRAYGNKQFRIQPQYEEKRNDT